MADIRQAVAWLKAGKRIRRAEWSEGTYLTDNDGEILQSNYSIVKERGRFQTVIHQWATEAVLANDWEMYDDPPRFNEGDTAYLPLTIIEVNGTGKGVCVYLNSREIWMDANSLLTQAEIKGDRK